MVCIAPLIIDYLTVECSRCLGGGNFVKLMLDVAC